MKWALVGLAVGLLVAIGIWYHGRVMKDWKAKVEASDAIIDSLRRSADSLGRVVAEVDSTAQAEILRADSVVRAALDSADQLHGQFERAVGLALEEVEEPSVRSRFEALRMLHQEEVSRLRLAVAEQRRIAAERLKQIEARDRQIADLGRFNATLQEEVRKWQREAKPKLFDMLDLPKLGIVVAIVVGVALL